MSITGLGNVGIGTTDPGYQLEISNATNSQMSFIAGGYSNSMINFGYAGSPGRGRITYMNNASSGSSELLDFLSQGSMYFETGGSNASMTINSSGNVGIGTTDPSTKLHVNSTWQGAYGQLMLQDPSTGVVGMTFYQGSSYQGWIAYGAIANKLELSNYNNGAGGDILLNPTYGGNVGIGTTNPLQKLSVNGTLGIASSSAPYYTIFQGGGQTGNITYTLPVNDGDSGQYLQSNGSGVLSWATSSGGSLFTTGAITYLTTTTNDLALGGTGNTSPFYMDVSANTLRLGSGSSNGFLNIYGTGGTSYLSLTNDGTNSTISSSSGSLNLGTSGDLTLANYVNIVGEGNFDIKGDLTGSRTITIGDTGKANDDVVMVDASNWSVGSSGMVNASFGGLGTKVVAGEITDASFTGLGTVFNGLMGVDSSDNRLYIRHGGTWHYAGLTGGFQIPNYEVAPANQLSDEGKLAAQNALPFESSSHPEYLTKRIESGDFLIPYADESMSDDAVHGLYARWDDVKGIMFADVNEQLGNSQLAMSELEKTLADQNISTEEKVNVVGSSLADLNNQITDLNTQVADLNIKSQILDTIQSQMEDIKAQNTAIMDFFSVLNPETLVLKDAEGNVDLLKGKLEAEGLVSGVLTIKVVEEEKKTIGKDKIYKVDKDENGDGIDDDYNTDGKSVFVKTKAVSLSSRIFITPKVAVSEPLAMTGIEEGNGFWIKVKSAVSEDVEFDWFIVEEKSSTSALPTPENPATPATSATAPVIVPETAPVETTTAPEVVDSSVQ